jgi:hypothetical protein
MLRDDLFAELEESERKMLLIFTLIKFNDEIISLIEASKNKNSYSLSLTQSKQFDQIRLINISTSIDLIDLRDQIRKMMTSKDQYVA